MYKKKRINMKDFRFWENEYRKLVKEFFVNGKPRKDESLDWEHFGDYSMFIDSKMNNLGK